MKAPAAQALASVAPSYGPAVIEVLGVEIPVLALGLSLLGLVLARMIAPPPARKLSKRQDVALTVLLAIILFLAVTGQITGAPMGVGMAFVWAIGLGFSGLLVLEFFGHRMMGALKALFGNVPDPPPQPPVQFVPPNPESSLPQDMQDQLRRIDEADRGDKAS